MAGNTFYDQIAANKRNSFLMAELVVVLLAALFIIWSFRTPPSDSVSLSGGGGGGSGRALASSVVGGGGSAVVDIGCPLFASIAQPANVVGRPPTMDAMPIVVQKYGGSSVADVDRMRRALAASGSPVPPAG